MKKIAVKEIFEMTKKIFLNAGASDKHAELVANLLVKGSLSGHPSHGVLRIHHYLTHMGKGLLDPKAEPKLEKDFPSYALVDGNRAFGQVAATYAAKTGIVKAAENGMAMVACFNMAHIGRLGDYVSLAAQENLLALALCNGGGPNVAPFGSMERVLGTNPMACAVPLENQTPILIDFGSASTVEGKLNVARSGGKDIDPGMVIDNQGRATVNPNDFYDGGAILPIGEHKGSALSVIMEIFGGIFTGGRCSAFDGYLDGNGILFIFMQPDLFRPLEDFNADARLLKKLVLESKKASGTEQILFPGQKEEIAYNANRKQSLEIDDNTWDMIESYYNQIKHP